MAFNQLCVALTDVPMLEYRDPHLLYILNRDASNEGLGAVLSQAGPQGEHLVAFFS